MLAIFLQTHIEQLRSMEFEYLCSYINAEKKTFRVHAGFRGSQDKSANSLKFPHFKYIDSTLENESECINMILNIFNWHS